MYKCTRNFYEEPVNIRNTKLIAAQNGYDTVIDEIKAGTADGKKVAVVGAGLQVLLCILSLQEQVLL